MKRLFVLIFALLVPSVYAWEPDFYFTIPPDQERCFRFDIPKDFLTFKEGRYQMNLTSDLPVNINFIETNASSTNRVEVPICFSAKGKNESEFGHYKFELKTGTKTRRFGGGICISALDDADIINKKGDPCDLINTHNGLFSATLRPKILSLKPESRGMISLHILSQEDIDLEARVETSLDVDKNPKILRLQKYNWSVLEFNITAPQISGEYNFSVFLNAIINREYCKFPFCQAKVDSIVEVGDVYQRTGWDFEVIPKAMSTNKLEFIDFLGIITNYDDQKEFILDFQPPEGLKTDFQQAKFSVKKGEEKQTTIRVIPENLTAKTYSLTFTATSDKQETENSYLTVGGYVSDVCRRYPKLCPKNEPPKIEPCKIEGTGLINTSCLINPPSQNQTTGNGQENGGDENPPLDPLFVVIPVLLIILILICVMFKKRSEKQIEIG